MNSKVLAVLSKIKDPEEIHAEQIQQEKPVPAEREKVGRRSFIINSRFGPWALIDC